MDELIFKGRKYISSKRAAEITGYAKDYVGQLVRMQKLPAERVGRAWYVEESAILRHAKQTEPQTRQDLAVVPSPFIPLAAHSAQWEPVTYLSDDTALLPNVKNSDEEQAYLGTEVTKEKKEGNIPVTVVEEKPPAFDAPAIPEPADKKFQQAVPILPQEERLAQRRRKRHKARRRAYTALGALITSLVVVVVGVSGVFVPSVTGFGDQTIAAAYVASPYYAELFSEAVVLANSFLH